MQINISITKIYDKHQRVYRTEPHLDGRQDYQSENHHELDQKQIQMNLPEVYYLATS